MNVRVNQRKLRRGSRVLRVVGLALAIVGLWQALAAVAAGGRSGLGRLLYDEEFTSDRVARGLVAAEPLVKVCSNEKMKEAFDSVSVKKLERWCKAVEEFRREKAERGAVLLLRAHNLFADEVTQKLWVAGGKEARASIEIQEANCELQPILEELKSQAASAGFSQFLAGALLVIVGTVLFWKFRRSAGATAVLVALLVLGGGCKEKKEAAPTADVGGTRPGVAPSQMSSAAATSMAGPVGKQEEMGHLTGREAKEVGKMKKETGMTPGRASGPESEGAGKTSESTFRGRGEEVEKKRPVFEKVRPSALAGLWYEANGAELARTIDEMLRNAGDRDLRGHPIALVVPHAGYQYSGPTAAQGFSTLRGRSYDRVFLLGPSHHAGFHGVSVPDATHYETPLGRVEIDYETVNDLASTRLFMRHPYAHKEEHSLEIQLPFLQRVLGEGRFRIVPMLISHLTREEVEELAMELRTRVGPGDLLVASSDFTHYGPRFQYMGPIGSTFGAKDAPARLDELLDRAWAAIQKLDTDALFRHKNETGDTICGFLPIAVLLSTLPDREVTPFRLKSDTSGRITGDYRNSVSYMSIAFTGLWPYERASGAEALSEEEKRALLDYARRVVERYVKTGERLSVEEAGIEVTERLKENSGAFVTLKKQGHLRGCIGNILPVKPLVKAVQDNAVNAAAFDSRFYPVRPEELPDISVEVSVLTRPKEIKGVEQIILGRHGVIIHKGGRSAVFLPQVAPEQGWTVSETLSHLSMKAGLGPDGWEEGARFEVFEAIVFGEE